MIGNTHRRFWKWYLLVAVVFAVVISFNFTRPFGFFRESNPALVAINAKYWDQHPEIRKQHIPIASYAFDKTKPPATQFEYTITTFGFGWFSVPYYFLKAANIPVDATGLRIFSVLWLLLTVLSIFKLASALMEQHANKGSVVFLTIAFYVLSPAIMWYQVNGYVHETAVLPFYYLGWYFFLRLLHQKKIKWLWMASVCIFIGIQFDWLPFFQAVTMSAYLLLNRKERLPRWMFVIPALFVFLGGAYILYTYASWSSVKDYLSFMKWKFGSRTVGQEGHSFLSFWPAKLNILLFYIISYGALLTWAIYGLLKKQLHPFVLLMIGTAMLHHIVFWGFSSEHDYAAVKMAFPICFIATMHITNMKKRNGVLSFCIISVLSICQYFVLHNYSYRKGMYADERFFIKVGEMANSQPVDHVIFLDTENKYFPQVEFYAGRAYKMATSVEDASQQMMKETLSRAIFIDIASGRSVLLKK